MGFFLFLHMLFKSFDSLLEVTVDLEVALDNSFHAADVFVHIVIFIPESLDVTYELALFREEFGRLLQIFQMLISEFFFLFHEFVCLLVES